MADGLTKTSDFESAAGTHLTPTLSPLKGGEGGPRGFTLIEVLVAFVIAALALGVLFKAAGGGLGAVHTAGRYEEAVSRAQSHLAAIGRDATLTEGDLQGDDGGGFHWRLRVEPVAVTKPPASDDDGTTQPVPPWPVSLYKVTVGISWVEDGKKREVALHSQRLGQAEHVADE